MTRQRGFNQEERHHMFSSDERFTFGLLHDLYAVLEAHGYRRPEDERTRNRAAGRSLSILWELVNAYEGDTLGTPLRRPQSHPQPPPHGGGFVMLRRSGIDDCGAHQPRTRYSRTGIFESMG